VRLRTLLGARHALLREARLGGAGELLLRGLASHAAAASLSHFLTKLFLAAPASFLSAAIAAQLPPPPAIAPPPIAPLAAIPGASLCELANAEVEQARRRAADSVIRCFMNMSPGWGSKPRRGAAAGRDWTTRRSRAARRRKTPQRRQRPRR
jgi:hypothetical protein